MGTGPTQYAFDSEVGGGATRANMGPLGVLRLLTYLSPGLPLALFAAVADHLRRCPESWTASVGRLPDRFGLRGERLRA
jgi:hypothetical protein